MQFAVEYPGRGRRAGRREVGSLAVGSRLVSRTRTLRPLTLLRARETRGISHGVDVQEVDPCVLNHVIFATLALKLQYSPASVLVLSSEKGDFDDAP